MGFTEYTFGTGVTAANLNAALRAVAPGFHNAIINGEMQIDQRGDQSPWVNNTYSLDRWLYSASIGELVIDGAQDTSTPNDQFAHSLKVTSTTKETTVDSTDVAAIIQRIEGHNFTRFKSKACMLSFWVRSSLTGTYCVAFQAGVSGATNGSYVAEYTINVADTWEFKDIQITFNPSTITDTAKWPENNVAGAYIVWTLGAGSAASRTGTGDVWDESNRIWATTNQVDWIAETAGATFYLTGVQLELGDTYSDYLHMPYGLDLGLCERYMEKSYNDGVVPGTATLVGEVGFHISSAVIDYMDIRFRVKKRATPTVLVYSPFSGGAAGLIDRWGQNGDTGAAIEPSMSGFQVDNTGTPDEGLFCQFTAISEL